MQANIAPPFAKTGVNIQSITSLPSQEYGFCVHTLLESPYIALNERILRKNLNDHVLVSANVYTVRGEPMGQIR